MSAPTFEQERLGQLLGLPVVVSEYVPRGQAFLLSDGELLVPDLWRARLSVMLMQLLQAGRLDLWQAVRDAEQRLGLLPCEHPRTVWERDEPRCGAAHCCAVCGERLGFVGDEQMERAEEASPAAGERWSWYRASVLDAYARVPPDLRGVVVITGV